MLVAVAGRKHNERLENQRIHRRRPSLPNSHLDRSLIDFSDVNSQEPFQRSAAKEEEAKVYFDFSTKKKKGEEKERSIFVISGAFLWRDSLFYFYLNFLLLIWFSFFCFTKEKQKRIFESGKRFKSPKYDILSRFRNEKKKTMGMSVN